jgi:hypothetical protein
VEAFLLRVIDYLVFFIIITVVPIGVDIVREGNGNDKPSRISALDLTQAILAKLDSIDRCDFTKIDLNPAVPAVASPARPGTI